MDNKIGRNHHAPVLFADEHIILAQDYDDIESANVWMNMKNEKIPSAKFNEI